MDQQHPTDAVPPIISPPRIATALPARQSAWPTVIGIILIVLGCYGLLVNLCGGVAAPLMPMFYAKIMPPNAQNDPMFAAQIDIARKYLPFTLANAAILFTLAILLLIAGARMLKRRRSSVNLTRTWAIVRLVWAIPAAIFSSVVAAETYERIGSAASQSRNPMPGNFLAVLQHLGWVAIVVVAVFVCVMPIFTLIWFSRARIRAEVAQWRG